MTAAACMRQEQMQKKLGWDERTVSATCESWESSPRKFASSSASVSRIRELNAGSRFQ